MNNRASTAAVGGDTNTQLLLGSRPVKLTVQDVTGKVCQWDEAKREANIRKHGIDFHEAATVLGDTLSTTFPDDIHSSYESRFVTIGRSGRGRVLVVVHAEQDGYPRIISARRATHSERGFYEEGQ